MTINHVVRHLFDDMEMYNKKFDRKLYLNKSEGEIITEFREYYNSNLPVDVTTWERVNKPDKSLLYGEKLRDQISYVQNGIGGCIFGCIDRMALQVISTHVSKSVTLPVMELTIEKLGIRVTMRCNMMDWNISVESLNDDDIIIDYENYLTNASGRIGVYQGFPKDKIFKSYDKNNRKKFSLWLYNDQELYYFMCILKCSIENQIRLNKFKDRECYLLYRNDFDNRENVASDAHSKTLIGYSDSVEILKEHIKTLPESTYEGWDNAQYPYYTIEKVKKIKGCELNNG